MTYYEPYLYRSVVLLINLAVDVSGFPSRPDSPISGRVTIPLPLHTACIRVKLQVVFKVIY
jgi:hypothetical protein